MNKTHLFALIFFALAGCGGAAPDPKTAPLAGARMGGGFNLIDQNGRPVSEQAFRGTYRIVYFGYSFCPDVCPVDVQVLSQGLTRFEKADPAAAAKIVPIFISVDPKRDTSAALKSFASNFHPRLVAMTGSAAEVARVAKAYGVYFELGTPNAEGGYLVNHTNIAVLYGPEGQPIETLPHDKGAAAVADVLGKWVH